MGRPAVLPNAERLTAECGIIHSKIGLSIGTL